MSGNFTFSGDPAAEKLLEEAVAGIAAELSAHPEASLLRAVILGGGYGRGEGGVTPEGGLSNDLDFFVVTRGNSELPFLREISHRWEAKLGIDVDFSLPGPLHYYHRIRRSLMIQELLAGNRVIWGEKDILDPIERIPWEKLPWDEGARLLLNRGTGLLLARQRLAEAASQPEDLEFIRRNLHKAALGAGDALLLFRHRYRQRGLERREELAGMNDLPLRFKELYAKALAYKYRPCPEPEEDFVARGRELCDYWTLALQEGAAHFAPEGASPDPVENARRLILTPRQDLGNPLRNLPLNLVWLRKLPTLFPLTAHPRLKLLLPLAQFLRDGKLPDAHYLYLWQRFN